MKHHSHDLTVILTNKRDNLVRLVSVLNTNNIKLDKKKVEALQNFDVKRIEKQDGEEAKDGRNELTSISDYLLAICSQSEIKQSFDEYQQVLAYISELENVYRHHLMMYNADVLGYNFWISFFPTRFIYKILRLKPKENI